MYSIKSVCITVPHESHRQYCAKYLKISHVALRVTVTYQTQISDDNTRVHSYSDKVTNITLNRTICSAYYT